MSFLLAQELQSEQPFLDIIFNKIYRTNQSWDGHNPTKDIIFERFQVSNEQNYISTIFPDGYSTISIEFDQTGHTSPCYFGRMRQAKEVVYHKNKHYFVVKIPPHYIFNSKTPPKELANRVSRLENFTDAFDSFPWQDFTQRDFEEQIRMFQVFVHHNLPYTENEIVNYILTKSLVGETTPLIKDLVADLGISERYLRKLFTELLGSSPKQIIQAVRLQQAMSQVMDQSKNITDVCLEADFYDQPHFNKFFKNHTTYSPTEFKDIISG